MNRASPVELRKAIEIANAMVKTGVLFVAIPVIDEADHAKLKELLEKKLEFIRLAVEAEGEQP